MSLDPLGVITSDGVIAKVASDTAAADGLTAVTTAGAIASHEQHTSVRCLAYYSSSGVKGTTAARRVVGRPSVPGGPGWPHQEVRPETNPRCPGSIKRPTRDH